MADQSSARDLSPAGRYAVMSGASAAVLVPGLILAATVVAPWFDWRTNALSDLGVTAGTALLFNGALVGGSVLSLPYAWALWSAANTRTREAVAVVFGAAIGCLGLVGVFVAGHPLHLPAALGFYLLATIALGLDATGRRDTRSGVITAGLAGTHLLSWIAWGAGLFPAPGLALPEFIGAVIVSTWVLILAPVAPVRALVDQSRR